MQLLSGEVTQGVCEIVRGVCGFIRKMGNVDTHLRWRWAYWWAKSYGNYAELSGKLRLSICIWGRDGAIYGRSRTVNHVISGGKFTIPHSKFTRSGAKVKYTPTSPQAWSFGRAGVGAKRQPCHSSSRESNPLGLVFQVSPRV